jgi:hypothetical protein
LNKSSLIHRQLCVFLGHATFSVKKSCTYFLSAPVNNGNTFLAITGGTDKNGSGATAICQK